MATKIIYTCDRCKKERSVSKCELHTDYRSDVMRVYTPDEKEPATVDLCAECITAILREMRGEQ